MPKPPPHSLDGFWLVPALTIFLLIPARHGVEMTILPMHLEIIEGLSKYQTYIIDTPIPSVPYIGINTSFLKIYPLFTGLDGSGGVQFDMFSMPGVHAVSGTVDADYLNPDDLQRVNEDISCLTGDQGYSADWGFKVTWINNTYRIPSADIDIPGSNSFKMTFSLDTATKVSYVLLDFHNMEVTHNTTSGISTEFYAESVMYFSPTFLVPGSRTSNFEQALKQGNGGQPNLWLFRTDTMVVEWNNVQPPPLVNVSGIPVTGPSPITVNRNDIIVIDVTVPPNTTMAGLFRFTLSCPDIDHYVTKMSTDVTSFNVQFTGEVDNIRCNVTFGHGRLCGSEATEVILLPLHMPTDLTGQTDETFVLFPGEDTNKAVTCSLATEAVYPTTNVTLKVPGLLAEPLDAYNTTVVGNQTVYHFRFGLSTLGNFTAVCDATNSLQPEVTAQDSIAFEVVAGPSDLTAGQTDDLFPLCPGVDTNKTFTCSLTTATVSPKAIVVLTVPGLLAVPFDPYDERVEGNQTVYYFRFIPSATGKFTAVCDGTNSQVPELTDQDSVDFEVVEPPVSDPVITVDGNPIDLDTILDVALGSTLDISCEVHGGHPNVYGVNLTCAAGNSSYGLGTQATTQLTIGRQHHQTMCWCSADHRSQCYTKTGQFTVTVQQAPAITSFTVNSMTGVVTIAVGQSVTFLCEVEGIPASDMVIKGKISDNVLETVDTTVSHYSHTIGLTKTMSSEDSDIYVCTASNGVGDDVDVSVTVSVRCPPQLFKAPEKSSFPFQPNGLTTISFRLVSRPPPVRFLLFRLMRRILRGKRDAGDEMAIPVDQSLYRAGFNQTNQQFGTVELDMFQLESSDHIFYRLDVANEEGHVTQVRFETVRKTVEGKVQQTAPSLQQHSQSTSLIIVCAVAIAITLSLGVFGIFIGIREAKDIKKRTKLRQLVKRSRSQQPKRY